MKSELMNNLIGAIGGGVAFICFICYFFGMRFGFWGTLIGIGLMGLSCVSHD